jgi:hypothetical protein
MQAGINAALDCIKALSETDFTGDLQKIDIPVLVAHGDTDQIVPIEASALRTAELLPNATPGFTPERPTVSTAPSNDSSTPISLLSSPTELTSRRHAQGISRTAIPGRSSTTHTSTIEGVTCRTTSAPPSAIIQAATPVWT